MARQGDRGGQRPTSVFATALPFAVERIEAAAAGVADAARRLEEDPEDVGTEERMLVDLCRLRHYSRHVRKLCRLYFGKDVIPRKPWNTEPGKMGRPCVSLAEPPHENRQSAKSGSLRKSLRGVGVCGAKRRGCSPGRTRIFPRNVKPGRHPCRPRSRRPPKLSNHPSRRVRAAAKCQPVF